MYSHILLATDLSNASLAATHKANELTKLFNAKLTIIHTIEPIPAYGYPGVEFDSPIIDDAKKELSKLGTELNVPTERQLVEFGSVKAHVLQAAEKLKVDLILVGSHGRHGLARILGSNSNAIVQGATCDVFVIRAE